MIAKMQEVLLAGRQSDARRILAALQTAGVMHIQPIDTASLAKDAPELSTGGMKGVEAEERRGLERRLARVESTVSELGVDALSTVSNGSVPPEAQWDSFVESVARESNALSASRTQLENDSTLASSYSSIVAALADMSGGLEYSSRVALIPFTLDPNAKPGPAGGGDLASLQAALSSTLADRFLLETRNTGTLSAGLIAVKVEERDLARAALSKARIGELRLPGRFDTMPYGDAAKELARVASSGSRDLSGIRAQIEQLNKQHGASLSAIRDELRDRVGIFDAHAQGARGKYGFALRGHVPVSGVPALEKALEPYKESVVYSFHQADEHHADQIPVKLENQPYVKNFEFLLNVSSPPRYGTFDPSWIVSLFFPFFFGFVIADIGLGLLFLAAAGWMRSRAAAGGSLSLGFMGLNLDSKTLNQVGYVVLIMSLWSILWGFLTGEFFGTLGEHFHWFYIDPGLYPNAEHLVKLAEEGKKNYGAIPILFPRVDPVFAPTVLLTTIGFGIVYLFWSWGLRAQLSLKHKEMSHFWEALGMLGGMLGLVLLGRVYLTGGNDFAALGNFSNPLVWLMLAGFALFLVGAFLAKIPLMVIEILSQGGNIISFSRLFAVGLASAILANLATDLGWGLGQSYGIIGGILGIVVAFIVHSIAIALTLIGHVMQPLRLHYVEFLNPTGFYADPGPRYSPFKRSRSTLEP